MVSRIEALDVPVHVTNVAPRLVDSRRDRGVVPVVDAVAAVHRTRRLLRRLEPDVVHAHSLKSALISGVAARSLGVPFVWHLHDRIALDYLPRPKVAFVRAALRVLPNAIAVNSETTLSTFRSGAPRVVVPNPVPPAPNGFVARAGRKGPAEVFGIVGRIAPWKGQDVFLQAFARAFPEGPSRAVIVGDPLFGEQGFRKELEGLAAELGVADRVELKGFREDIWSEFAQLDVLIHASRIPEPFGLVIVEALAGGLAVIASDAGGPKEIIDPNRTGILTPPGDVHQLAAAMRLLSTHPTLVDELATAGSAEAKAYSLAAARAGSLDCYRLAGAVSYNGSAG